ncbi:hypothetical protein [Brevibacillus borstelensis]|uniref:hypothetical protein n=1 Tax=Brevibacillus borstelensis TaxID=45462 RepID=UPI0030BA6185
MNQNHLRKSIAARLAVETKSVSTGDLAIINSMTRREFTTEELYVFPVLCCHTRMDREGDRFTRESLNDMVALAKGVTFIFDHRWSAYGQTARVYKAEVRQAQDGEYELVGWAYMPKNENTQPIIDAIDAGILKEVSVGFGYKELQCSVCKQNYFGGNCPHLRGREYDGEICFTWINGVSDWYEISFVAVPAQQGAGIEKSLREKMDDEKEARLKGGESDMNLIEFLKSLGVEVKDDDHALSIVKGWKEQSEKVKGLEDDLQSEKELHATTKAKLEAAQKEKPDATLVSAGQKFFEESRNEIIKMAGMLDENTKTLEVILRNVTDIDGLLEIKQSYQEKVDKRFPPDPQSKGALGDNPSSEESEIDMKNFTV